MANVSVVKLKVRRGTDAQRKTVILDQGELGFVTDPDSQRLFVGDGVTYGGISVASKLYFGSIGLGSLSAFQTAQLNDIIYDVSTARLYALTAAAGTLPDNTQITSYGYIGPRFDNRTLTTNVSGIVSVSLASLSGTLPLSSASIPAGQLCYKQTLSGGLVFIAGY